MLGDLIDVYLTIYDIQHYILQLFSDRSINIFVLFSKKWLLIKMNDILVNVSKVYSFYNIFICKRFEW